MAADSMWPGMFQAEAGRGNTASVRNANQWRLGCTTFQLLIMASYCLCRRQGGLTIFAPGTRLKIDRLGITSTYHSNPKATGQRAGP